MTVCAISTPLAEGGISVIRISGDKALDIAVKVFEPLSCESVEKMAGYTCAYGRIRDPKSSRIVDDGVLTVFRAPHSYTGEDVCEISCHGGVFVTKKVLRLCLENGARLADRGEFTKIAFLNGKLSLTQAEAVMDVISAQGEFALSSANLTRQGRLFGRITEIRDRLVGELASLAAWVDYPDDDVPAVTGESLNEALESAHRELKQLLDDYDSGMILKSGIDTAIVGKPNVGKSTLMNLMLGYDRSIVTDIAGTTRDVIEETASLGEYTLRLSDTAGIREASDQVEAIGVELAKERIGRAMLILAVFDRSNGLDAEDRQLVELLKSEGKKTVVILNKSDLEDKLGDCGELSGFEHIIEVSAKEEDCRELLLEKLRLLFPVGSFDPDSTIFANERQKECVRLAFEHIKAAEEALAMGETFDAVTVLIGAAADELLTLTGEKATEAVVDEVFSRFCVGK
ncbi:MAG: tRNA uridine-5-carboxymethylaminomethyl(34) synthesis GTPase MnmE [Ruminococcus sp.]|nr:tRNA uridine-5-carboxymethylaminomethyl(34) synthesis GTPase MnmE [Ruminococcus sp.]